MDVSDWCSPRFHVFLELINAFLFAIAPKHSVVIHLHNLVRQINQCILQSFVFNMLGECKILQDVFSHFLLECSIVNKFISLILIPSYFVSIFLWTLHVQFMLDFFKVAFTSSIAVNPLRYKGLVSVKEVEIIKKNIKERKQYKRIQEYSR